MLKQTGGKLTTYRAMGEAIVASVVLHGLTAAPLAIRYGRWFDAHGVPEMQESTAVEPAMLRGERRE